MSLENAINLQFNEIIEKGFTYIKDNAYLVPINNEITEKQHLGMYVLDKENKKVLYKDGIHCIHTVVMEIPAHDFEETIKGPDFKERVLKIRSTENYKEVELCFEEKKFALKSWVEGIAQAGIDSLIIQDEMEIGNNPIKHKLTNFALINGLIPLETYLDNIRNECYLNGKYHPASTTSKLLSVNTYLGSIQELQILNDELEKIKFYNFPQEILDKSISWDLETKEKNQKYIIRKVHGNLNFDLPLGGQLRFEPVLLKVLKEIKTQTIESKNKTTDEIIKFKSNIKKYEAIIRDLEISQESGEKTKNIELKNKIRENENELQQIQEYKKTILMTNTSNIKELYNKFKKTKKVSPSEL